MHALLKADLFNHPLHPADQPGRGPARRGVGAGGGLLHASGAPSSSSTRPRRVLTTTAVQAWITDGRADRVEHAQRRALLPADPPGRPAARRADRRRSPPCGAVAGVYRPHRRAARRVEGAGRARRRRSPASPALAVTLTDAENGVLNPLGHQLPAHVPGHRAASSGARARCAAPTCSPTSASTSRCGGSRCSSRRASTAARSGWSSSPTTSRCGRRSGSTSARSCTSLFRQGAFQGTTPARGLLRQVRRGDDDPERHRPRHRQHPRRLRAAQARRVRRHPDPADRRPDRRPEEGRAMAQFTRQRHALRPVQELQVPREVGRPLRRRRQQGQRAQAHHRGRQAPRGRRPEQQPQVARAAPSTRPITLERGVTHDTEFEQWANKVWNFGAGLGAEVSLKDFRKDIIIEVYNEAGQLAIAYKVYRCWVSEYQALPDLDANANAVAIQHHQARERGLGARLRRRRADRADLHRAVTTARPLADPARPPGGLGGRRRPSPPAPSARCCCTGRWAGRRPRRRAGPAAGRVDRGGRAAPRRGLRRRRGRGRRLPRLRGDAGGRAAAGRSDPIAGAAPRRTRRGHRSPASSSCAARRAVTCSRRPHRPTRTAALLARCVTGAGGTAWTRRPWPGRGARPWTPRPSGSPAPRPSCCARAARPAAARCGWTSTSPALVWQRICRGGARRPGGGGRAVRGIRLERGRRPRDEPRAPRDAYLALVRGRE